MRVISADGQQLGILSTQEAIRAAEERGLDLVEVSPLTRPPVCRIMDYGKYKYTQKKKQASAKKRAMVQALKEVKLRPKTEEHDYQFKLKHINRFLQDGNKAKVTVRFRGREMAHKDIGMEMLHRIIRDVGDLATVASEPTMEGRLLQMILTPSPKALAMLKQTKEEHRKTQEGSSREIDDLEDEQERETEQSELEGR